MKFSIKYKIIALGAILSILVTSAALLFANFEYRRRGESRVLDGVNSWLEIMQEDFDNASYGEDYLKTLDATQRYIDQQYLLYPDDPSGDMTEDELKLFYKNRFKWLYAIEGLGMYYMTDEERDFRNDYEEFVYLLSDAKDATKASAVYMAYLNQDNTLFFMADEYSYKKITRPDMLFPGSRIYNFSGNFVHNGKYYDCNYDGKLNRVLPVTYNGSTWYVFIEYNFNEVYEDVDSLIKVELIVLSIASILMILAYTLGAHFLFLRNISRLTKVTSEFTTELNKGKDPQVKHLNIKSHDEMHELSNSFVALEEGIIKYIGVIQKDTQEKERRNAELSVAKSIQLGALPDNEFDDERVSVRSFIKSAKEVGGDFYDYFYLDDHRLAIIISDVSGKGIPAALFMMKSKELIKSAVRSHANLVDAVNEVNKMLSANNNELLFVTSFIGVIDFKKNTINFVNCGHEKPYIVSSKKIRKLVGESNFVIGGVEVYTFKEESTTFEKGEYLFLFTDGLNESINSNNEEFSYLRIEEVLNENKSVNPKGVIEAMNARHNEFVGKKEQFDDVTMVVIKNKDNKLELSYNEKNYKIIADIVDRFNDNFKSISPEIKSKCGIIIDELINNLVSYEKRADLKIDISFEQKKDSLTLKIKANGEDYDPFINHKEKYIDKFHPDIKEGGFGLSIIKDLSESYSYEYKDGHSHVTVVIK